MEILKTLVRKGHDGINKVKEFRVLFQLRRLTGQQVQGKVKAAALRVVRGSLRDNAADSGGREGGVIVIGGKVYVQGVSSGQGKFQGGNPENDVARFVANHHPFAFPLEGQHGRQHVFIDIQPVALAQKVRNGTDVRPKPPFQYRLREVVGPVGVVDLLKGHFCAQHSAAIVLSRVALQFFRPKGDYMAEVIPEPA